MKKTATVTWLNYRNFGTYLQAYALQKAVEGLGYSNKVIDDALVKAPKKRFSPVRMLRSVPFLYPKRAEFNRKISASIAQFDSFKNRCISVDKDWKSKEDLAERYDIYIAGSDQIWSPTVHYDDFYYLGFTDRTKVAYAPSLGTTVYPDSMVPAVRAHLESFAALSVRERQGAEILKDKLSLDAQVVADPTMLLTREEWDSLVPESQASERPYVLCYFLTYNKAYLDSVRKYCRTKGLDMKLLVVSHDFVGVCGAEEIYTGPEGFLKLLKGAETVMTDSFHATIFSLIFRKDFLTFKRFKDGTSGSQNSRLENLLARMDIADRFVSETSLHLSEIPVDHDRISEVLKDMRTESLRYLAEALGKDPRQSRASYAAYAKSTDSRSSAASGGAASMIARAFVEDGGIVYGCSQGSGVQIGHVRIDKVEDIGCLSGSRYVLSQTSDAFVQMKKDLSEGRHVLFIGLPCQVAGAMRLFSQYSGYLFTIDLCCHGTPSRTLLKEHLCHIGLASKADKVIFRTKEASGVRYVFKVYDSDGRCMYDSPAGKDWYMTGFISGHFLRECCFSCPYASPDRISDLTLADHWAMGESSDPEMKVSKGLTTVLLNTEKGRSLFERASEYLNYEQRPLSEALRNGQFIRPSEKPVDYDMFMACLRQEGYEAACSRYMPLQMRKMRVRELQSRYYKSPLRQYLRKLFRR